MNPDDVAGLRKIGDDATAPPRVAGLGGELGDKVSRELLHFVVRARAADAITVKKFAEMGVKHETPMGLCRGERERLRGDAAAISSGRYTAQRRIEERISLYLQSRRIAFSTSESWDFLTDFLQDS